MKANYNEWFYKQHKYLKSKRDGLESFTDTKWVNAHERFMKLVDMESELLNEQPFMVRANNKGFDMLLDLMGRSNYTFEDLSEALKETYRTSLQQAMSYNMVNTHAIMFHTDIHDTKHVFHEKFSHYKIIDIPFDQLHFGPRDEFIRQKLHEMHLTENDYYIDIDKFNSKDISDILDFCILCTANGFISNDCKVAIDDHGFKFKIGWKSKDDVEFIIYKLDKCRVYKSSVKVSNDMTLIPYDELGINKDEVNGTKCLVNIYSERFKDSLSTVPNFGLFTDRGLYIGGLQKATTDMINNNNMTSVNITVYSLKYFFEVPNIFPAVNYYEIVENKVVYDEKYEKMRTPEGDYVVESTYSDSNDLEICTPPITIDRDTSYTFNTIVKCLGLNEKLMTFKPTLMLVGNFFNNSTGDMLEYEAKIKPQLYDVMSGMANALAYYKEGAIVTSLVSTYEIKLFDRLYNNVKNLYNNFVDFNDSQSFSFPELYDDNYNETVRKICKPFMNEKLQVFARAINIPSNFYDAEDPGRFNHPISEQCFISLRYSEDAQSWIFAYPTIEHFHGIGNTFYVNENLTGNEIFKFFILYTDTMDPMNKNIEHFDFNTMVDFDLFYTEMSRYYGCIRYWDAESRLAKISKMLYSKYDDETCVHVLSRILKRKIDGDSILEVYPSDINYEESNSTTDNLENYDEDSYRGPFSVNFLFYTLSMMNGNVDKLQAYFYRTLTNNKYSNRYVDVDIRSQIDETDRFPVGFAGFWISPIHPFPTTTVDPISGPSVYYGMPIINSTNGQTTLHEPYRFVFNSYDDGAKLPHVGKDGIDYSSYTVCYHAETSGGTYVSYQDDIEIAKLVAEYVAITYDAVAEMQTNYHGAYDVSLTVDKALNELAIVADKIKVIHDKDTWHTVSLDPGYIDGEYWPMLSGAMVFNMILNPHGQIPKLTVVSEFERIKQLCQTINVIAYDTPTTINSFINTKLIKTIKSVHRQSGFDESVDARVHALYNHLIKINEPMNAYVFKKWLNDIDLNILEILDDHIAFDPEYDYQRSGIFSHLYDTLNNYITNVQTPLEDLDEAIHDLTDYFHLNVTTHMADFCRKSIAQFVFDLYIQTNVSTPQFATVDWNVQPVYALIQMPDDSHTTPPYGTTQSGDKNLLFKINSHRDLTSNKFKIDSLSNICEYVFFDGTQMTNMTIHVLDENGVIIGTMSNATIDFVHIGSTADRGKLYQYLPNTETTVVDFENHHESFEIYQDKVVNEKCADMNYELLIGNNFTPLDHSQEYILNSNTWNPGSIDRITIENQLINTMCMVDRSHKNCLSVYFKPCQVYHPSESVNGKYFEGERVYVKTSDGSCIFPITITSVDHSINKGFIEARVDQWNATWLLADTDAKINDYMMNPITCEVIGDGVRNFLDEYSNGNLMSFYNPGYGNESYVMDDKHETCYILPGDPIYVTSNAPFVYTRLNWMFNEDVPNRFIDEESKTYRFIYVGEGFINDEDGIRINMINHNFNNKTLPEKYPVLRDEPNDHVIRRKEIEVFTAVYEEAIYGRNGVNALTNQITYLEGMYEHTDDYYARKQIMAQINDLTIKRTSAEEKAKKFKDLAEHPENATTWFNVTSYDTAMVYIDNGRAKEFSPIFTDNIRDLLYTDKLGVFIYDWENKHWVDPSTYTITIEMNDGVKLDERDDYETDDVLTSITINPTNEFVASRDLLIYFGYNKSDVFDDVQMNPTTFNVRFKPVVILDKADKGGDPYYNIKIRKHFDGYEKYTVTSDDSGDIHVKRIKRSGKYVDSPVFRTLDLKFNINGTDYDHTNILKLKVKSPFTDFTTQRKFNGLSYTATINSPVDGWVDEEHIKLICISNNEHSSYDGNISTVMFEGVTTRDGSMNKIIRVTNSNLPNYVTGRYICTVLKDSSYDSVGGVVTINVTSTEYDIYGDWVTVPAQYMLYHELPDEFIFTPVNIVANAKVIVTLENKYVKDYTDTINESNTGKYNPYEYYYDATNHKRIPISDVRTNNQNKRLVINQTLNPDIKLTKSTYIGICRYSLSKIPVNGIIDMTGYLPTPLSRARYEFWVNGRCISGTDDLIILSPTSIQLRNMRSLHNFECIELVDDVDMDNDIMHQGCVYVDINGNTYANYKLALLSNTRISKQNMAFIFNANNHEKINDYVKCMKEPNNQDIEEDILASLTFDTSVLDFNLVSNKPSINGITLLHPKLNDLGISEIDNMDILKLFDKVWKHEAVVDPFFMITHRSDNAIKDIITLHVKEILEPDWHDLTIDTTGMFVVHITGPVDKFFSLYVSDSQTAEIDEVTHTKKIIPFISSSVYVLLDASYKGMWLHSTHPNTKPIHII